MGIGEQRCGRLAHVSFSLGDALLWRRLLERRLILATLSLGDASSWRRPALVMLALGVTPPGRRLTLTLTSTLTLTLTLTTPGYGTVQ